ncbi:MAG TPA: FG-GAP-like repeat-containing protein [Acidimicrobiales bacterium]|nr:FG-GAP-like repeat-containing protein [Acidimicrobiales bacterium]
MGEPLGRRLREAAAEPSRPLDLGAVERRAGALRRRTRLGGAALVLLVGAAAGLAVAADRDGPATRVATTPATVAEASDQLVVTAAGVVRVVDAAGGAVLRQVAVGAGNAVPTPLAVDPGGTVYGVLSTHGPMCKDLLIASVDLATGARSWAVDGPAEAPAVSPDGQFLAYLTGDQPPCEPQQVVVRDLRSGAEQRWPMTAPTRALSWTRDGRRLLVGGARLLDTALPAGPDNPSGPDAAGTRFPVMLADGRIAAVKPLCPNYHCAATIGAGDPVVVLDPATGEATGTLLATERSPGVVDALLVDPSGRRLAVLSQGDLYVVEGGAARLVAHRVDGAAWLPRSLDAPPAPARAPDDMDGDGRPDKVTVEWDAQRAVVVADLTTAGRQTLAVSADQYLLSADPAAGPAGLGMADVDGDGRAEAFVKVNEGASLGTATLVTVVGGTLSQVTLDGRPAALEFGGGIAHSARVGCGAGTLVQATWDSQDTSQTYDGTLDTYVLAGGRLERQEHTTHQFLTFGRPPTDGDLAAAGYLVHCPGID